uniref:Uncharacterized protein n=1 Tax=Panagrolaimus sp. PS1159 TaxID=55785 RepID=A0AC35FH17_9BILA
MAQNTSSSSSINAAIDSFPLLTLENFVNSMNEQNGFGRTFNNATFDNHRSHPTISTTIPQPSSFSPPFHCTLPSNFNASVSVSGTSDSRNRVISNSSNIPSSNIPPSAVISSTDSINNNGTTPHQCFGKKNLTAFEYSKNCDVHHVNRKPGGFASTWRLRCMECAKAKIILDPLVEYVFCFVTTFDGAHCFMIKLHNSPPELFLIPASVFRTLCPII